MYGSDSARRWPEVLMTLARLPHPNYTSALPVIASTCPYYYCKAFVLIPSRPGAIHSTGNSSWCTTPSSPCIIFLHLSCYAHGILFFGFEIKTLLAVLYYLVRETRTFWLIIFCQVCGVFETSFSLSRRKKTQPHL